LAFFDFSQVQSAKLLCDLTKRGLSTSRIRASLAQLQGCLPNLDVSLSQLALLEHGGRLLVRWGDRGLIESTGQLQLDFGCDGEASSVPWSRGASSDELFDEALDCHDQGRYQEAADLYRRAIELDPKDPILHFNLANAYYECGLFDDSCAAYLAATQLDPHYVEAWNALGCVLSQMGRGKEAIVAFRRAVELVPDYGDAHFNLASELEQGAEYATANQHWQRYLELDPSSPWAETALERIQAFERERAAT
jgi:tetratricopeptide (TPR) repeat protein